MPKKKILQRISHHPTTEEKNLKMLYDFEADSPEITRHKPEERKGGTIKHLTIRPVGYPIKPFDAPDNLQVLVNPDERLFQSYALEQWAGITVKLHDYLFDQLLLPDFAFQVIQISPKSARRIGISTKIHLEQTATPRIKVDPVTFDAIIGNHAAKEKAAILIEYLKDPKLFGAWAPKNLLFYGSPGTGKTLLARAIATETDCTFLARKGTSLIGVHVGDGAAKIHALFQEARDHAPAIIFIDELDSIGLNRGYQNVRGDVVEVATALLAELDGLTPNSGIITIGATNGIELLDMGIRNRFEEEIEFPLPTETERESMLRLFAAQSPLPMDLDFPLLSRLTEGWSGRALHEKLMKIAIHRAIHHKIPRISTDFVLLLLKSLDRQQKQGKPPSEFFS